MNFLRYFLMCRSSLMGSLFALPIWAAAQESAQSLDQAASDPTASLASVQVQDQYTSEYHNLDDQSGNSLLVRAALPFQLGGFSNIFRVTLPLVTDSPSGADGIGDMTVFDLVVFPQKWGRWGVGPVALLPTANDPALGAEQWAAGPALGFVVAQEKLMLGLFNQNLFSFAGEASREDVGVSILQPIVNYSLPNKWSVGSSEMNFTYDWERSDWSSLPLGMKVAKLNKFGGQPVQFSLSVEHNFADDLVAPKNTINLGAKFLFPM